LNYPLNNSFAMTPEQLKLLQQLSEIGEITFINRSKENFQASSDYLKKNTYSLNAIFELISIENCEIAKDEIIAWEIRHKDFFDSLNWSSINNKNLSKFYDCYIHIRKINKFFILEEACFNALQIYNNNDMGIEIQLLKWIVEYEDLHDNLKLLHPSILNQNNLISGRINLFIDLNRYFKLDTLKNCISFEKIYEKYYYEKFNKYKVEDSNIEYVSRCDDKFDNNISLKYHLEKRNLFVDKINYIPLPGLNAFLYYAPNFTEMKHGVNLELINSSKGNTNHSKGIDEFEII